MVSVTSGGVYDMLWEFMGFPGRSTGKQSAWSAGDLGSINGWGRSPGEWLGYPLHYSWASLVPQTVKNPPAKKKKESTCSTGDPGGRHSYCLQYSFLENLHGQWSLARYIPLGDKESDTTEWLSTAHGSLWEKNSIFWLKKKRNKWFQSSAAENVVCASSRKSW